MTTKTMKYTLDNFNSIAFNGFKFDFPQDTLKIISELALEVGSPNYVKTPIFQKRVNPMKSNNGESDEQCETNYEVSDKNRLGNIYGGSGEREFIKRKKGNKNVEIVNDCDWEALRSFQTTKIEEKVGFEAQIDLLRSHLNKLTDKNYIDIRNKIVDTIETMVSEGIANEEMLKLGTIIFEIASTNRFYSKIYADLYSDLINKYNMMKEIFEENFNNFMNLFETIEYVEPSVDYNKFCKINKDNEKRKALAAFFINLMNNNIISKEKIVNIVRILMSKIYTFVNENNKKNEVDEITENINILYKKQLFDGSIKYDLIDGNTINELIQVFAHSKSKNYLSMTNKSIFKFMDLIDM